MPASLENTIAMCSLCDKPGYIWLDGVMPNGLPHQICQSCGEAYLACNALGRAFLIRKLNEKLFIKYAAPRGNA